MVGAAARNGMHTRGDPPEERGVSLVRGRGQVCARLGGGASHCKG